MPALRFAPTKDPRHRWAGALGVAQHDTESWRHQGADQNLAEMGTFVAQNELRPGEGGGGPPIDQQGQGPQDRPPGEKNCRPAGQSGCGRNGKIGQSLIEERSQILIAGDEDIKT